MKALHGLVLLFCCAFSISFASARNSSALHAPWKEQAPLAVEVKGDVHHQVFNFPARVAYHRHFRNSETIFKVLYDNSIWQSNDEGYTWTHILPQERFLSFMIHPYANDRAYLLTLTEVYYYSVDGGRSWTPASAPAPPSRRALLQPFAFHPTYPDYLMWMGDMDCHTDNESQENCHVEAFLSLDHGAEWRSIESHASRCLFAATLPFDVAEEDIVCAAYRDKTPDDPLALVIGRNQYAHKHTLFENVIGFEKRGDRFFVLARNPETLEIEIHVSPPGNDAPLSSKSFVKARLPADMPIERQHVPRIFQATDDAVFLQLETVGHYEVKWNTLLKSDYTGTNYTVSLDHLSHHNWGIGYSSMPGMPGVSLANILSNPDEVFHSEEATTAQRKIKTRITHNDGGWWSPLYRPPKDSNGVDYPCHDYKCSLHLFFSDSERAAGQTEASGAAGLMLAAGNVGEFLGLRKDASMFLTRNGGFTWDEVHKGPHKWAFGDSGSILVIVDDEQLTDHVLYSTDYGLHWREYNFGMQLRAEQIFNSPGMRNRKFILIGHDRSEPGHKPASVAVHLDFTGLAREQCKHDPDEEHDDFERWSPHWGERHLCLLGAEVSLHRKKQSANCYIGEGSGQYLQHETSCVCTEADYECAYNHVRNSAGKCVVAPGVPQLTAKELCRGKEWFWYEPAAYRKISASWCIDGFRFNTLDRPTEHFCPGDLSRAYRKLLWWLFILNAIAFVPLLSFWCYRRRRNRNRFTPVPTTDPDTAQVSRLRAS